MIWSRRITSSTACAIAIRGLALGMSIRLPSSRSGSVISADIPADALALERAPLTVKEGWAKRLRERKAKAERPR